MESCANTHLSLAADMVRCLVFGSAMLVQGIAWCQDKTAEQISLYVETGIHHSARSVTFSPNKEWLAASSLDRSIKIWDIHSSREILTLKNNSREEMATFLRFLPSGQELLSSGENGTV